VLPDTSLAGTDPVNEGIARDDYRFVRDAIGPCPLG